MKKLRRVSKGINPKKVVKERQKNLVDFISDSVKDKGVVIFTPDTNLNINNDYLTLPSQLSEVKSRELGDYLNAFTQQQMYMRTLLGWQELVVEQTKREYFDSCNTLYNDLTEKNKKMSETAKERIVNNTPEVKPYFIKYKDAKERLKLMQYSMESIGDAIFLLSREISRKSGDITIEGRNNNVQEK
jgi:hypothetical protein